MLLTPVPAADCPFRRLTTLACVLLDAPSAMVSVTADTTARIRSSGDCGVRDLPRNVTVTQLLMDMGPGAVIAIEDMLTDPRTSDHPLVKGEPKLRWFVGQTITDAQGRPIGALAVTDTKARPAPSPEQMRHLDTLAAMAGQIIDGAARDRQREEQLEMLRLAEQMARVGHWRVDLETRAMEWSDEVYRIHGVEPSAFVPTPANILKFYDEADQPNLAGLVDRALSTGEGYEYRVPLTQPDGKRRYVASKAVTHRDEDGRLTGLFGLLQDVTDEQVALNQVRRNEERYRLLADHTGDVIARVRADGVSKYISPAIEALLGWRYLEMSGQAMDYVHPEDRSRVLRAIASTIRTGKARKLQHRALHRDGRTLWVECHFQNVPGHRYAGGEVVVVIRDISERKALELELTRQKELAEASAEAARASEARYRLIADRSNDVIVTYDYNGIITYMSPSVIAVAGLMPGEVVGRPIIELIYPDDQPRVLAEFQAFVEGRWDGSSRYRIIDTQGTIKWMEARRTIVRNADGRITEFQDVVRDITATKELEDQLILEKDRAEGAARAKSAFLANMSHELRTPLTSVIGFSGLLKQSGALAPEQRRHVDRIAAGSEALLSVINDILDYSKLEAGAVQVDPRPFNPRTLVEGVTAMIEGHADARGLRLDSEVTPSVPVALMGDEGRLRQVLLNFLSNAVKFTAEGGVKLVMDATPGDDGRTWIAATVTDTGIGISADQATQLFERFVQADASTTRTYGGTGLGLAISRQLIEIMGGEIGAHGAPGVGSSFWFRVPLDAVERIAVDATSQVASPMTSARILVADDAPANRELVGAILGGLGLTVILVENGAEAVKVADDGGIDLILMDVHMPVMDGLDAARTIRQGHGPSAMAPILALTANVGREQVQQCLEAGMNGHLAKPIEIDKLVAALNDWLAPTEASAVA
jgi:PAS domain S-box-containing protein